MPDDERINIIRMVKARNKAYQAIFLRHNLEQNAAIFPGGETVLHFFVAEKELEATRWLLDQGADPCIPDKYGLTPLHSAVLTNNAKMVQLLLEYNANISATDASGGSPLSLAAALEIEDCFFTMVTYCNAKGLCIASLIEPLIIDRFMKKSNSSNVALFIRSNLIATKDTGFTGPREGGEGQT